MRFFSCAIIMILLVSCQVHNSVPKVASNSSDYVKLDDKISSTPRYLNGDDLKIIYQENYNDQDGKLEYKIYNQKQDVIQSNLTQSVPINYGLNKLKISLNNLGTGIYVLEIINEKGVKKYLTFLKSV